mmetsp:Transcript_47173/g.75528  ORF Transcript_47173/g.75528 Transcript_47173/m.75528 type:complete len:95 (-) Transcript_47173:129-413(-)
MATTPQAPTLAGAVATLKPPVITVTTELIQKYLDENQNLITAILESQNVGKLQDCMQYQAKLQHNLMYLAAIADATPVQAPPPAAPPQLQGTLG